MHTEPGGVGLHLLLDLHGVQPELLTDLRKIEEVLIDAARATGATVLHSSGKSFGEGMGVTAVALLSESHASIHTWPEKGLAIMDFFTCGNCNPRLSINPLLDFFKPETTNVDLIHRGNLNYLGPIAPA